MEKIVAPVPGYPDGLTPPSVDGCININEQASLSRWVTALDCSELQLRVAVAQVGAQARDVCDALGRTPGFF
jgi:Protein of unknown function (DUF3606)